MLTSIHGCYFWLHPKIRFHVSMQRYQLFSQSERGKVIVLSNEPGDVMCHNHKITYKMITLILRLPNPKQKQRQLENQLQVFNDYLMIRK